MQASGEVWMLAYTQCSATMQARAKSRDACWHRGTQRGGDTLGAVARAVSKASRLMGLIWNTPNFRPLVGVGKSNLVATGSEILPFSGWGDPH
jgi:hypothetical protein